MKSGLFTAVAQLVDKASDELFAALARTGNRVSRLAEDEPAHVLKVQYGIAVCVSLEMTDSAPDLADEALYRTVRDLAQRIMKDAPTHTERTGSMWISAIRFRFEHPGNGAVQVHVAADVGPSAG